MSSQHLAVIKLAKLTKRVLRLRSGFRLAGQLPRQCFEPGRELRATGKISVMKFSQEMRSDPEGLGGPEWFDRICQLFIAAVLWLLVLGYAGYQLWRMAQ